MTTLVMSGGKIVSIGGGLVASGINPLGANLQFVQYASTDLPFINIMKSGGAQSGAGATASYNWLTLNSGGTDTGEEYLLSLDLNGYPLQIPQAGLTSVKVECLMNWTVPVPPGATYPYAAPNTQYTVLYDGIGTLGISGDATATITTSGSTFTVTTPSSGIALTITASTNGNNVRNVRIVETALLSSFNAGAIFHPTFLSKLTNVSCLRYMGWQFGYQQLIQVTFGSSVGGATSGTVSQFNWSGTTSAFWQGATGAYPVTFADGETRSVTLTNGASTASWTGALSAGSITKAYTMGSTFATRSVTTQAFYGNSDVRGVPLEIMCALSNQVGADMWICMPLFATDADITSVANLINSTLNSNLNVYIELSNEVWNAAYLEDDAAACAGKGFWSGLASDFEYNRNWFGMRTAVMSELLKTAFGGQFSRCIPVLGGQMAATYSVTDSMSTPAWTGTIDGYTGPASAHQIKGIGVAPYFPADSASTVSATDAGNIKSQSDGGINYLIQLMTSNVVTGGTHPGTYSSVPANGWLGQAEGYITSYLAIMSSYPGVKLVGYEGGQQFDGSQPAASPLGNSLVYAVNRDAGMGTTYANFLNYWAVNVGSGRNNILNLLSLCVASTGNFAYGLIEGVQQNTSPGPPKWQAFQNYIL